MRLNRACELEDFRDPEVIAVLRVLEPDIAGGAPDYPAGREHRKTWEQQHTIRGARHLGALNDAASVLVVNAGTERVVYALTNMVASVFAVDNYCADASKGQVHSMLLDPRKHSTMPFNPRRLKVQHMNAPVLVFEDETFDLVLAPRFSGCPVEGGSAALLLLEIERVLRPGGLVVLAFEMAIDGGPARSLTGFELHTPSSINDLVKVCPDLILADEICDKVSSATLAHPISLEQAVRDSVLGRVEYPHIVLQSEDRLFTSGVVFLRKAA